MYDLHISFKEKKHLNKFLRNLKNNKGTIIKPEHLEYGQGFFDSIANIAKKVAPVIAKPLGNEVANLTGSNLAGNLTTAGLQSVGKGMKKGKGKKGGNLFNTLKSVAKTVAPVVAPVVGQQVANMTGSQLAGNLTTAGLKSVGSGMKKGGSKKGKGFVNGIGGETSNEVSDGTANRKAFTTMDAKEKMAYIRGFRGKKGGSMVGF